MARTQWPIIEVALDDLTLDIENVRLAIDGLVDDSAIASYLAEEEDLVNLARDILRDGYLDNEIPIVVEESGAYTVMEANRRVAALKAIHEPALLGRHSAQLDRHLTRYAADDAPTTIRVMLAPTREAAAPVLARLHTGDPKRKWPREQQAVFYHARLSDTVGADELKAQYPREAGKIVSFIRMGEMRELIRSLRYTDAELEQFVKGGNLKMSSLEYAYDRPQICEVLGLKFETDGRLESTSLSAGQRRGLMYLLQKFKDGVLNTRSRELKSNTDELAALVDELRQVASGSGAGQAAGTNAGSDSSGTPGAPGGSGSSGGSGGSGPTSPGGPASGGTSGGGGPGSGAPGGANAGAGQGARGPNRGNTLNQLDFNGFTYNGSLAGLRRRFEELQRINVREYPNASHDLIRTVLECSIKDYFDSKGAPLQGRTTLGPSITALAADFASDQRMTTLINAINRSGRMPTSQYSGTADSLNATNHNPDAFATHTDVHEAWDRIKPILAEIVG